MSAQYFDNLNKSLEKIYNNIPNKTTDDNNNLKSIWMIPNTNPRYDILIQQILKLNQLIENNELDKQLIKQYESRRESLRKQLSVMHEKYYKHL